MESSNGISVKKKRVEKKNCSLDRKEQPRIILAHHIKRSISKKMPCKIWE